MLYTMCSYLRKSLCGIIINFPLYDDDVEVLKHKDLLPMGVFVSEDFPDVWVRRMGIWRQKVTLLNKMDNYKGKVSLSGEKLIPDE